MSNIFKVCDKCKASNLKSLIPKLKEIDAKAEIKIGCQNLCGIGRTKPFVIVNHVPIIASDEHLLIEKVKEHLQNE